MSALLQNDCRFQTADSAACDQNGLGLLCFGNGALCLAAYCRVSEACDVFHICVGKTVIAALVAADTINNVFCPAFPDLVHKIGISQLGAAHDDHVYLILFEDLFCELRGIDPANTDGQHSGLFADPGSIVDVEAPGKIHWRHFKLQTCGDNVASRDVQHVYACSSCHRAERNNLFDGQTAFEIIIVCIDSHEQRHAFRNVLADRTNACKREFGPVLQASAVLIRPVIDPA